MMARSFSRRAADLPFGTVVGGPVVVDTHQLVGRILLCRNTARLIVGVLVALGIAERGGPRVVAVAQVRRHQARPYPP